jgi:hypothetical protein
MIRNLTAMTASHLKRDAREERKKSMLSRMSPEAKGLFDMLAAKDWRDGNPSMNSFMKHLMADKDANRALSIMRTRTKDWGGQVSEKGLLNFFASGYEAPDIHEQPGGFSIFMFRPVTITNPKGQRDKIHQVRAMFGESTLDDEAIKFYASNDFFLADTIPDLEEQIYTCIMCLDLFTERRGIAAQGFEYGLRLVQKNRKLFKNFLHSDRTFAVKFSYLLDRVFQNFLGKLGDYHGDEEPVRAARSSLRDFQTRAIDRAMIGFDVSSVPNLYLPSSLRGEVEEEPLPETPRVHKEKGGRAGDEKPKPPAAWWTTNPNVVAEWGIPAGKAYADFFDTRSPEKKANTQGWPQLPHHKTRNKKKGLCLKYQIRGECSARCFLSHVDPAKIDRETKKTIGDKLRAIYAGA